MACNFFDLDCQVFMDRVSTHQKPYRRVIVESYGASVTTSPSERTACDRQAQAEDPDSPGALGIAISEAVEAAVEPTACPSLTRGRSTYDFGDTAELALIVKLHTLGHPFVPPGIHAGGLACRAGVRPRPQYARVNRPSFIED